MNKNLGTPPSLELGDAIVPVETLNSPKLPWRLESGQAKGESRPGIILSLITVILVSGCTAASPLAPLPVNHPASPAAPEAPPPSPSQAFNSESAAWVPAAEGNPKQNTHARHGAVHGGHR